MIKNKSLHYFFKKEKNKKRTRTLSSLLISLIRFAFTDVEDSFACSAVDDGWYCLLLGTIFDGSTSLYLTNTHIFCKYWG